MTADASPRHFIIEACTSDRDRDLLRHAADLHYESLSYRSFITSFGRPFLRNLYRAWIDYGVGFLLGVEDAGHLLGFILACPDGDRVMSVLFRRPFTFGWHIAPRLLIHPSLIGRTLQSLSYGKAQNVDVKAELLVIAVDPTLRSKGIGSALLADLDREFARRGTAEYKVTVHQEMQRTNQFYVRNGMELVRTFPFYGTPWNVYVNRIAAAREGNPA